MLVILQYLPLLGLVLLANLAEKKTLARRITYAAYLLINLALFLAGVLFILLQLAANQPALASDEPLSSYLSSLDVNIGLVGLALCLMGSIASLLLLPAVRRLVSRILAIDPDSCMDCTGLLFTVYYLGFSWTQIALLGGVSNLGNLDVSFPVDLLLLSGLMLVLLALFSVGLGIRRDPQETLDRLGVTSLEPRHLLWAVGGVVGFLALEIAISAAWSALAPESYRVVSEATEGLFGSLDTPARALALALATGIGEEILFRGAIQPRFGLWFTSLIFAMGHLQYGLSPALLQVFILSLGLGLVRQKANTTTCMIIHGTYNLADLLLVSLLL